MAEGVKTIRGSKTFLPVLLLVIIFIPKQLLYMFLTINLIPFKNPRDGFKFRRRMSIASSYNSKIWDWFKTVQKFSGVL